MGWLQLISLTLGKAAPLLLASFGGLFSELSGVINFGLEGMMLMGAFGAVWTTFVTGSPWVGLVGGSVAGIGVGLVHALACLRFRANQIVSSIALNLLAAGLSGMLLNQFFEVYGTSPSVLRLPVLGDTWLRSLPVLGPWLVSVAGGVSVLALLAVSLGLLAMGFFRWSVWSLRFRACGENPLAASAAGLSVVRIRVVAVLVSGALAGLGGAYLSIGELSQFVELMTHGRGYLAVAAVILGRWRPCGVFLASLFFGLSEALSEWLAVHWPQLPYQAFLAFPYIVCLTVLMLRVGVRRPPSALGRL